MQARPKNPKTKNSSLKLHSTPSPITKRKISTKQNHQNATKFQPSLQTQLFNSKSPLTLSNRHFALNLSTVHSSGKTDGQKLNLDESKSPPPPPTLDQTPPRSTPKAKSLFEPKSPLTITESAQKRVKEICNSQDPPAKGIRLGVRTRGCSGLSYTMNFSDAPKSRIEEKIKIPNSDIQIFIDDKALLYLIGTTMDWSETDVAAEFTFNNPNSKGSCGCGESFTV
jgi:iron-sulfur cluster assembly protein